MFNPQTGKRRRESKAATQGQPQILFWTLGIGVKNYHVWGLTPAPTELCLILLEGHTGVDYK
jgi:hypothetical protein